MNPDIFEPFERLIEISLLGKKVRVPENNTLLRCFQYLSIETVTYGDFCWNGDCLNCRVWVRKAGKEKAVMSCAAKAEAGMEIVRIGDEIKIESENI